MSGVWFALDLNWVNPPHLDEVAHHKPYQLAVATSVGLTVPRTLNTNDPCRANKLISELGPERTIYKTFLATEQCWRETRIIRPEELKLLDSLRLAPAIFQEYVPAVADIRATVVGDHIFAAAISAASGGYHIDYRMDLAGATFRPTELSPETTDALFRLMSRLGLVYGAIDLRRTSEHGDVFLEINPAGEWLFVEERTGQPITQAMADLLVRLDKRRMTS
jgi:glutathione synthase/RimK-type ligase-like ATP-grasp enzyme